MHATGSRNRLTPHQLDLYPGDSLFARLARTICGVGVLPRKELHEAWEVARRVRRRFRGGRVVDLCCGHGLLAQVMLLLEIFFSRFDGDRDCFILATFNQAKLESLARSHKESSEWEKLCYRIHRVKLNLPRYKNLSFDFMRRMGRYLFGKLPGKSSSPTRP